MIGEWVFRATVFVTLMFWGPGIFQSAAHAVTFEPGNVLDVHFEFTSPPQSPLGGDVDVLFLSIPGNGSTPTSISASLFDGDRFLGTHTQSFVSFSGVLQFFWVSSSSLFNVFLPPIVDFAPIIDGSIDGRIEITASTGSIEIDVSTSTIEMAAGQAISANSFTYFSDPNPLIITDVSLRVPEIAFIVYDAETTEGTPPFEPRKVLLADQFETGVFEVEELERLGAPADLDDEGIADPLTHLLAYEIERAEDEPEHEKVTVRVTNRFGEIVVDTDEPDRLLVPTAKDLDNPVGVLPPGGEHFKCYEVELAEGEPEFVAVQVFVQDQFIASQSGAPKLFDVKRPISLCNPVDKDGEGITDADRHLLCYEVKRAEGEPKHEDVSGIHTFNQFGALQVDAIKVKELCVPSEKEVIGVAPPADDDD